MEVFMNSFVIDNSFFYFTIIMVVFAIGDWVGILSKAKISSVFVVMLVFLLGFMFGIFPEDIVEKAKLTQLASMAAAILIFHMGTMINLKQLIAEWKTVVTAALSMVVVGLACLLLIPVIGKENAIVAIPVLNGGIISTQIMSQSATQANLEIAAVFAAILYAVKKFAGSYPASYVGMKEAKSVLNNYRNNPKQTVTKENITEKAGFAQTHERFFTDFTCLMISVLFAWLSVSLNKVFPSINYSLWALAFGAILGYKKWVPAKILEKGKSSGFFSMLVYVSILPSLAKVKLSDLGTLGFYIVITLAVTILVLYLVFSVLPGWKLVKSKHLAFGISLCQYLGFPATYLIAQEISKAVTDDETEQQVVLDHIMPSYVVAGMATVTTLSIVVASFLVNYI